MLTIDMTREQFEDALMIIAVDHLSRGCDDTCEFYRRDLCDAVPIHCTWATACGTLQADRKRIAKLREKGGGSIVQTNPVKAIREKCLECSCGQPSEVSACPVEKCALYPFRFGKNPYRSKRILTDEQREALASRLADARKAHNDSEDF